MLFFWRPAGLWAIAVTFMLAAATYAALGLLIGVLVRGDLEGFFLIIMIAMLDTFLENPVDNPLANKPILEFFPSYGPTQFAAAEPSTTRCSPSMAAVSLAWTAAFALLGLAVLRLRMPRPARAARHHAGSTIDRHRRRPAHHQPSPPHQTLTAAVAQTSGGPGRNPGESGLPADQRVVPPPAARASQCQCRAVKGSLLVVKGVSVAVTAAGLRCGSVRPPRRTFDAGEPRHGSVRRYACGPGRRQAAGRTGSSWGADRRAIIRDGRHAAPAQNRCGAAPRPQPSGPAWWRISPLAGCLFAQLGMGRSGTAWQLGWMASAGGAVVTPASR